MDTSIKPVIKKFLANSIKNAELQDHDDIFELGYVNSLFALQLVTFVENEFQFTVENEDLDLQNFSTIARLTDFVSRKAQLA